MPGFSFTYSPPVYQNTLLMQCLQPDVDFVSVFSLLHTHAVYELFLDRSYPALLEDDMVCVFSLHHLFFHRSVCRQQLGGSTERTGMGV